MKNTPKEGDLRICHFPQIPCKPFYVEVGSVEDGVRIMDILADYDDFQFKNRIKPDYSNAQVLEIFEGGEWLSWAGDDTDDPREHVANKAKAATDG